MAAEDKSGQLSLEDTPTWAVAAVCFIFIFVSVVLERSIHLLINWLRRHEKNALKDAVERLKYELMLLGFISLLLAVIQEPVSKICVSAKSADTMLPCRKKAASRGSTVRNYEHLKIEGIRNILSAHGPYGEILWRYHRRLAGHESENEAAASGSCSSRGKVSLVTKEGIHQLHVFIFVLAVMQIVYSVLTMALGRAKMRRWKAWERETQTIEYEVANDPNRFRFTRQTTFGRRHINSCTETSVQLWIKCFLRQFFNSVAKVDYLTLRHGFISAHLSTRHNNFNFQMYIQRSLDEDFKAVVGISPLLWFIVVIFLLVDVHGWNVFLWVSCLPLLIVLVLGTKLEVIVARMALQIKSQSMVVVGTPLVQPNDNLFWFGNPRFVLTLLHFTLFMNAFEFAFFIWVTIEFGIKSCYHENTVVIVTRVVLAVTVQVLCSYITLPLYALVTQMGSQFRSKMLEERTLKIIKQWHAEVRARRKKREQSLQTPRTSLSRERSPRNSSTIEFSSSPESTAMPSEGIHSSNGAEISEEQSEMARQEQFEIGRQTNRDFHPKQLS